MFIEAQLNGWSNHDSLKIVPCLSISLRTFSCRVAVTVAVAIAVTVALALAVAIAAAVAIAVAVAVAVATTVAIDVAVALGLFHVSQSRWAVLLYNVRN